MIELIKGQIGGVLTIAHMKTPVVTCMNPTYLVHLTLITDPKPKDNGSLHFLLHVSLALKVNSHAGSLSMLALVARQAFLETSPI